MKLNRLLLLMVLAGATHSVSVLADDLADSDYGTESATTQDTTTYTPSTYDYNDEDTTNYDAGE